MIRFKDQVLEEYFIDPVTAVITDKNGVVQPVKLYGGRPGFKCMPVHQIMAHTFFGYKPGYNVHHKDENPLNNSLSNLVYLTRSEHHRLHSTELLHDETRAKISAALKGKKLSEETKAKISAATKGKNKGKTAWNKGKCYSVETCAKISAAKKGKPTWNKGKTLSDEYRAKLSESHKGSHWWYLTSGETKQAKECPGPEWLPGRK